MILREVETPYLTTQISSEIEWQPRTRLAVRSQQSQYVSFPVIHAEIHDVDPRPRAGDTSTGFEFLKAHLHPRTFFRLWHGAPLGDAVAMTE